MLGKLWNNVKVKFWSFEPTFGYFWPFFVNIDNLNSSY